MLLLLLLRGRRRRHHLHDCGVLLSADYRSEMLLLLLKCSCA
jgi:hypothetical protein